MNGDEQIELKQRFIRTYREFEAAAKADDLDTAALKAHECNGLLEQIEPWKSMPWEERS